MTVEREGGGAPARILQALQAGLVMLTLGIGVFVLIGTTDLMIGDNPGENDEAGFAVLATITTSIGVGLLLSAGASYGLSKRLGLVDGASR